LNLGTTGSFVETVGNPVKSMAYSYDCFFIDMAPDIEVLYFRMIWALWMPFLYLSFIFFGYYLAIKIKKAEYKVSIVYTTFIYMFTYLQPTMLAGYSLYIIIYLKVHVNSINKDGVRVPLGLSRCKL
jgi:hypothetical protein